MNWSGVQLFFTVFSAIALFIHGLQGLSSELELSSESHLKLWLEKLTRNRVTGFLVGASATAVLQSSSAVSSLSVVLVRSQVLSLRAALAVLIGCNVGTTSTAWLVSWKLAGVGPVFIVLGTVMGLIPGSGRIAGRAIFFLGFVLFSLDLLGSSLAPLREEPLFREFLARSLSPLIAIVAGALFTTVVQSSSVVTGVAILLVQNQAMTPLMAIAVTFGANIGTTTTGLLAGFSAKGRTARMTAVANLIFNVAGVVLFFPLLGPLAEFAVANMPGPGRAVALAHLVFNLGTGVLFLLFLDQFERFLHWIWREPHQEALPIGPSGQ